MLKFIPELTDIVIEEIPHRVTLAVEVTNCRGNCPGCHSPFLRQDIGEQLTPVLIDKLFEDNFGVNCFLFLGEGKDSAALFSLADYVRSSHPGVETALYTGRENVEPVYWEHFDFIKVGPYVEELGPLNRHTTNQRLYHHGKDITSVFWRKNE